LFKLTPHCIIYLEKITLKRCTMVNNLAQVRKLDVLVWLEMLCNSSFANVLVLRVA